MTGATSAPLDVFMFCIGRTSPFHNIFVDQNYDVTYVTGTNKMHTFYINVVI